MGAQLHTFQCVMASKVVLTGFSAHKLTIVIHVLVLVAQIWVLLVLSRKVLSEKVYKGAHLQFSSYKSLVKL